VRAAGQARGSGGCGGRVDPGGSGMIARVEKMPGWAGDAQGAAEPRSFGASAHALQVPSSPGRLWSKGSRPGFAWFGWFA